MIIKNGSVFTARARFEKLDLEIENGRIVQMCIRDRSTAQEPSVPDGTQTSAVYGPVKSDEMTYTVPTAAMLALPENGRVDMEVCIRDRPSIRRRRRKFWS